jgi:hypothetical protein
MLCQCRVIAWALILSLRDSQEETKIKRTIEPPSHAINTRHSRRAKLGRTVLTGTGLCSDKCQWHLQCQILETTDGSMFYACHVAVLYGNSRSKFGVSHGGLGFQISYSI